MSSDPVPKLACFEAIRGLAALMVLAGHFILGFWPGLFWRDGLGWGEVPGFWRILAHFPGKSLWDGHMAVTVFFVLSGFVLSLAYFQGGSAPAVGSAAVRRYPRLMIPVAASVFLAFALLHLGAICNQAAVSHMNAVRGLPDRLDLAARNGHSNKWLALYYLNVSPDLGTAAREATWGAFTGVATYNLVLWTMPIELAGSFLVYAAVALFGGCRNRWLLYAVGGGLLAARGWYFLLDFLLGVALCDLWVHNRRTWRRSLGLRPAAALVGVPVLLIPWKPVAAVLVVGAAAASPRLQEVLSGRWLAFLGRISFSLYLVHMLVFCSLGCGVYLLLCRDLGWSHAAASAVAALAALVGSVLAAWGLYHAADRPAIALTRRLDVWLFRPKAGDPAAVAGVVGPPPAAARAA